MEEPSDGDISLLGESDASGGVTWYDDNRDDDDSQPGARAHYIDNPGNDEELASRFCKVLVRKCTFQQGDSDAYFNWKMLGEEAGKCFNAVPSPVQFLAGSLSSSQNHGELQHTQSVVFRCISQVMKLKLFYCL